ncbi:MAG: SDR family oxidoreductase [Bacteroidales bacterium]|nr:SDR family oxidoreductase [Bacteroidales bacterium]
MNIIITGASSGIGYELVKFFALKGNHLIIAISRKEELLDRLKKECARINKKSEVIAISADLSETDILNAKLPHDISRICSHIDILVNNAGSLINKSFIDTTGEEARMVFDTNFFAPSFLIRNLLSLMGDRQHTHIVNISSMGGFQGSTKYPGLSYYSASKAALAVMTECLAGEFSDKNISVNCLALGAAQTEMLKNAFPGYMAPVTASEMAEFIGEFCLKGHRYFNGKIIPVALSNP